MTPQTSTDQLITPVTVIGLGPMGVPLADALLARDHRPTVFNRTPGKDTALLARGATGAATAADAVAASPLTLLCLKDYDAMYAILGAAGDALKGRVLVNLGSGTPEEARRAARWAAERGAEYLDGAIMVPPPMVGAPGSVFLYSGPREVFDRHRELLAALGDPRYLGSDPGLAVLHNTALLEIMYATMNGVLHATALVASAGVPAADFAELALGWFMPSVVNSTLAEEVAELGSGNYPGDAGTMEMNLAALEHIVRTSAEQGVHTDQPALMRAVAERAIAQGHGGDNYLAVYEVFRRAAAVG
ncbi:NAD(P)-dependent oxidoreductase [Streptomyces sp. NPDC001985]|uniref:NAD(P)-dependent oxidoreductase n=1 Tax=Streptomyces sp. NPDC001985 TaxID=3154406 RepID=UPI003329F0B0